MCSFLFMCSDKFYTYFCFPCMTSVVFGEDISVFFLEGEMLWGHVVMYHTQAELQICTLQYLYLQTEG
jgi:hypothetical protein